MDLFAGNGLPANARTEEWVASVAEACCSADSPVTELAHRFCYHTIDGTPKRRLSLDTDGTISDTSTTTPDKLLFPKLLCEEVETEPLLEVAEDVKWRKAPERGSEDSSGRDTEDPFSPVTTSPTPSSVFLAEEDEDTRDSGFSDAQDRRLLGGPTGFDASAFKLRTTSRTLTVTRKGSDDVGFFEEECSLSQLPVLGPEASSDVSMEQWEGSSEMKALNTGQILQSTSSLCRARRVLGDLENLQHRRTSLVRKSGLTLLVSGPPSPEVLDFGLKRIRELHSSPEEDSSPNPLPRKRRKSLTNGVSSGNRLGVPMAGPKFHRCHSESTILNHSGYDDLEMVGDYSQGHRLPLIVNPKIGDLKCISARTLADFMTGTNESFVIKSYHLVDCRYPYEYKAGHIQGAVNYYEKEKAAQFLFDNPAEESSILVFYCEYSQQRGPTMWRHVRSYDRALNDYPKLNYPEIYLLEDGYKSFFQQFSELCEPRGYMRMIEDPSELRKLKFKLKSKSWSSEASGKLLSRPGLQRSQRGLFRRI